MAIARMYVIKKDSETLILDELGEVIDSFICERDLRFNESWLIQESVCTNPKSRFPCPRELFMIFLHKRCPYIQVNKSNVVTEVVEHDSNGRYEDSYLDKQVNMVYH